jgi:hypothetical protein
MPLPSPVLTRNSLLEIDHFLVCVEAAIEADLLADLGLTSSAEVLRRTQQGTVSRLIFFENIYLELVWVEDSNAAESYALESGINFQARSQVYNQASPFGIALRQTLDMSHRPFDLLPHQQNSNYSETFVNFAAANLRLPTEPLCFVIPDAVSLISLLDRTSAIHQQLIDHEAGMKRLTQAKVTINTTHPFTNSMNLLQQENVMEVEQGTAPLLELSFDDRIQQKTLDLRWLKIPVVINY